MGGGSFAFAATRNNDTGLNRGRMHHVHDRMNDRTRALDLVAYADGSADVEMQRAVEVHISGCPTCAAAVDELRVVTLLLEIAGADHEPTEPPGPAGSGPARHVAGS